jgi:cold shock CspA family protein
VADMQRGKVKTLKPGFGFLKMDNGQDVFFLPAVMDKTSDVRFDNLQVGQAVEAEVSDSPKGLRASYVRAL